MSNGQTPLTAKEILSIYVKIATNSFGKTRIVDEDKAIFSMIVYCDQQTAQLRQDLEQMKLYAIEMSKDNKNLREEVVRLEKEVEELNNSSNYWEELYKSIT